MARGRPKKQKTETVLQFTKSEFLDSLRDHARCKKEAADYSRRASEHKALFTERTKFSAKAYGFLASLHKLDDPLKQQSLMEEIAMGVELMGIYDQGNLFDRTAERMERDVKKEASEEDKDLRPRFKQGQEGIPLDEAAKVFAKNAEEHPPRGSDYDPKKEIAEAKKSVAAKEKAARAESSRKAAPGSPLADTKVH